MKITHLGIGAHQDDLEIMAFHGIKECYKINDKAFAGIVCTNGQGSARTGKFANCTDEEMIQIRRLEQEKAAKIGDYAKLIQMDFSSAEIKTSSRAQLTTELIKHILGLKPEIIYTHNPADTHPTHVAVFVSVVEAIRSIPLTSRPKKIYGCEVWRDLDWADTKDVVHLDVSGNEQLLNDLLAVFESQIAGGKRYDLATLGRMRSNATYTDSHHVDEKTHLWHAIDLTPLCQDDSLDIVKFTIDMIDRFRSDVKTKLEKVLGR